MPKKTRTPNTRAAWSPNRIVRSDSRVDSYDRMADAVLNPGNIRTASAPVEFGEFGRAASVHEEDARSIPAMTSNSIDLSVVLGERREARTSPGKLLRSGQKIDPIFGIRTASEVYSDEQEESSEDEVLEAINSLAPMAVRRPDGSLNRTASKLLADLVEQLDLPERQQEWLTSQVRSGLLDERVFVRNVRHSMKIRGGAR